MVKSMRFWSYFRITWILSVRVGRKYRPTGQLPVKLSLACKFQNPQARLDGKIWAGCETEKTLIGWNVAVVLSLAIT